jgi:hypothetical protein
MSFFIGPASLHVDQRRQTMQSTAYASSRCLFTALEHACDLLVGSAVDHPQRQGFSLIS